MYLTRKTDPRQHALVRGRKVKIAVGRRNENRNAHGFVQDGQHDQGGHQEDLPAGSAKTCGKNLVISHFSLLNFYRHKTFKISKQKI